MTTSPPTVTSVSPVAAPATGRWLRVPAVVALLALSAGWILGAAAWPGHYSSIDSTISDLASSYAPHRAIMTAGLVVSGICLVLLAAGSVRRSRASRVVLGLAGLGVLVVAIAPLPTYGQLHSVGALVAFGCLAGWPLLGFRLGGTPRVRAVMAVLVTTVNAIFFVWLELAPGLYIGFAERALATAALLWVAVQTFDDTSRVRG